MTTDTSLIQQEFEAKIKKLASEFEFFAHVTSHDLRDPLRQARIYSDELSSKLHGEEKQKLESINKLMDEVLKKIAILRDFSYVANNKEKPAEIDLNKILEEIIHDFNDKIKSSKADVKITKLPIINGNAKHIKRLFVYLIDNTIEFCSPGKNPKILISVADEKDFWHFTISDNGIGLDRVYRELVFVLFQRLDNTPENDKYGEGLAFAKKIVENHGGKIWYESDGESGTTFHFTIKK